MDAAAAYLLYYESGVNVRIVVVLKLVAVINSRGKSLMKEIPDEEVS